MQHKEIYLQMDMAGETTWCQDQINEADVAYVLKAESDARIAELEAELEKATGARFASYNAGRAVGEFVEQTFKDRIAELEAENSRKGDEIHRLQNLLMDRNEEIVELSGRAKIAELERDAAQAELAPGREMTRQLDELAKKCGYSVIEVHTDIVVASIWDGGNEHVAESATLPAAVDAAYRMVKGVGDER